MNAFLSRMREVASEQQAIIRRMREFVSGGDGDVVEEIELLKESVGSRSFKWFRSKAEKLAIADLDGMSIGEAVDVPGGLAGAQVRREGPKDWLIVDKYKESRRRRARKASEVYDIVEWFARYGSLPLWGDWDEGGRGNRSRYV